MEPVTLFEHVTDGGAVYMVDNHRFSEATVIIRMDGGAELLRCGPVEEDIVPVFEEPKVYQFIQPALLTWECYEDGTIIDMSVTSLDAPEMWSECDAAPEFGGEDYDEWVDVMYKMTPNIPHYEPLQRVSEGIRFVAI